MAWKKLGLIYSPEDLGVTNRTHASLPVPIHLEGQIYRILFASRDEFNRSFIYYIDVELSPDRPRIVQSNPTPLLTPGLPGHFDDCGVYPASIVRHGGELYLYYIGWVAGATAPMFYTNVGLAISQDNGQSFQKFSPAPIVGRDAVDPWMMTAPFVLKGDDKWRMWYTGGKYWDQTAVPWQSYYEIKIAESDDGVNWEKLDHVCLPLTDGEHHISRVCVLANENGYESWYGVNAGEGYRIGYAQSSDGMNWKRADKLAGINLSPDGWDAKAQTYPYIIDTNCGRFMFYNGNGFGRTGIGVALWE